MFTRNTKLTKLAVAAVTAVFTLTTLAPAALADRDRRDNRHHKRNGRVVEYVVRHDWRPPRVVERRVVTRKVIVHHYPSRPVYYGGPVYAPVYANGTAVGGLLGAVLGAAVGSQFGKGSGRAAAIIGGSVLGAVIGGNIGRSMDSQDQYQANSALETARTGQAVAWRNPDNGNEFTVTPTRTYESSGTYCREYTTWGYIGGYEEKLYGTACRQPDGSWQRVN
ncbi:MAG: glycine zipper 2TM domain-containing protein [Hyphomicrobiales bacterium]|nr:glycine zipper 2TM domain-containing protein [Hyphomicrobiales bacterium]MCP5370733.1 glycine zipper 2TM domain-containing protein [Hyphomicrobiales bacterium]